MSTVWISSSALSLQSLMLTLFGILFTLKAATFIRNYVAALRTGYPIIAFPVASRGMIWAIFSPIIRRYAAKWFPVWIYERIIVLTAGFEFYYGPQLHTKLGKVFVVVSSDECTLWIADPALANVVLQRRKDFLMDPIMRVFIGLFGDNLLCVNGEDWQRHRRIVAPNLNERISESVWTESCRQAHSMSKYLAQNPSGKTIGGLRNIAINVLGHSGYGQSQPWTSESYTVQDSDSDEMNYFKAVWLVTFNLIQAALLPSKMLKLPFMPQTSRALGKVMDNIQTYAEDLLDRERELAKLDSTTPRTNVLSQLVQLSDEGRKGSSGPSLSESEIQGNLFLFTAAGFDTTANTMTYAIALLATQPRWQEWIREELQALDQDIAKWNYNEVFPKCQKVLAVMFETLRLYPPALHSFRYIATNQNITDSTGSHHLTPPMTVFVSQRVIHVDVDIWGDDADRFKPSRWIDSTGQIVTPPRGTFLPWSAGPRVCPGMKMAQVEFVATFATLFRSARCEILRKGEETELQAKKRLEDLMADSLLRLTLQMKNPDEVKLRWIEDDAV